MFIRGSEMKPAPLRDGFSRNYFFNRKGNNNMKTRCLFNLAVPFLFLLLLVSCNGKSTHTATSQEVAPATAPSTAKLARKYDNILFADFTASPEISKVYPDAAATLEHSMMTDLQMKKFFKLVGTSAQGRSLKGNTLLIKANITNLRIVGGAARFWGGAFAGRSGIELDMQLIDMATGKVVRKEQMSSRNNAFGAAWTAGSSDHSLLSDMGIIMAKYVVDAMPGK